MSHILDRPVWSALSSRHAHLAEGGAAARRYPLSIVPFAATADGAPESRAALAALVPTGGSVMIVQATAIVLPEELARVVDGRVVQMVATETIEAPAADDIVHLTDADAAEMLALATLTRPGPFTSRARALGDFIGVRIDGRLAAMAGERFRQPGFAEISGVCVHPDFRGRGLARRLSAAVAARIFARGEVPYLHAYETNAAAICLYRSLGFRERATLHVTVAARG